MAARDNSLKKYSILFSNVWIIQVYIVKTSMLLLMYFSPFTIYPPVQCRISEHVDFIRTKLLVGTSQRRATPPMHSL